MIVGYGLLVPLFLITLWGFFRFTPRSSQSEKVHVYNIGAILVALALCGITGTLF